MGELKSANTLGWWAFIFWGFTFLSAWFYDLPPHSGTMLTAAGFWGWLAIFTTLRWLWRRHTIRKARIQAEAMVEALASRQVAAR